MALKVEYFKCALEFYLIYFCFSSQVLIKPKPVTFQATVVSEQTRQLVTETLQQASRVAEAGNSSIQEAKEEPQSYTDSSSSSTESSQSSQGKMKMPFSSDLYKHS